MHTTVTDRRNRSASPEIVIRRVTPSDCEDLARFYGALSADSLRARFLGYTRGLSGAVARSFCTLDHLRDEGFVALATDCDRDRIVGHVCLIHNGARGLELAICVADEYQGLGIGRRLFDTALAWSRDHEFATIVATCYAANSRVLALLASSPLGARVTPAGAGLVDVAIPLQASRSTVGTATQSLLPRLLAT